MEGVSTYHDTWILEIWIYALKLDGKLGSGLRRELSRSHTGFKYWIVELQHK